MVKDFGSPTLDARREQVERQGFNAIATIESVLRRADYDLDKLKFDPNGTVLSPSMAETALALEDHVIIERAIKDLIDAVRNGYVIHKDYLQ